MAKKVNTKAIVVTAVISAAAFLMTFIFRFKVSFLTFDFKDAIIALSSLVYGPLYGVASAAVVAALEFISVSDTGLYGLIMNFLSSATFSFVCGVIYKYKRTFGGAILALVSAAVSVVAVMIVANIFITPFYMGVERTAVISMILPLLLPFNMCKTVINAASTLILYKPITNTLKRIGIIPKRAEKQSLRSVIISVVAILVIVLTVLFLILKLNGAFHIF